MASRTDQIPGGLLTLLLALATNAMTLVGVILWDWPAGNVFLLFTLENIATMLLAYLVLRRTRAPKNALSPQFFLMHSGGFTLVHTIFTLIIAFMLGVEPALDSLALPAALLLLRFAIEVMGLVRATAHQKPPRPPGAVAGAYGRVFALHLGIFPGMFAGIASLEAGGRSATVDWLRPLLGFEPTYGQAVVVALMLIKSIADVIVTIVLLRARSDS